jgi:hypothetical protein
VVRIVEGSWLSKAMYVVVALRIPDFLRHGPRSIGELAAETGTHVQSLHRLLRALAGEGLFEFDSAGRFSLTPAGTLLRSDVPGSLHHWALLMLGEVHQGAWEDLMHTARTGESAFQHRFKMDLWQYCAQHAEHGRLFAAAMAAFTATYVQNLLSSYSFAAFKKIVDVGGGDGSLLVAIMRANRETQGVVFDLPEICGRAQEHIDEAGLSDRCMVSGGDARVSVPGGADAYILSRVLHDWDDENATKILLSCRRALPGGGRILVIERAMPEGPSDAASIPAAILSDINMTDLNMMVMTSGRERTVREYESIFAEAALELISIVPTRTAMNIMEAGLKQ